ncbi:hypothetical protein [Atopobacter phocae]|uniref:hypothetical protein n=1 Tax=Atopobacter phocae TaxID=136492 RepID=UPI00047232B4|nr:hypothetical protein [Atopobacter phocae]
MRRTLLYYDLILKESNQMKLFGEGKNLTNSVKRFINDEIAMKSERRYVDKSTMSIFEILNISENHIFVSYGRLERPGDTAFTRSRNSKDFDVGISSDWVERYTYFYLDIENNRMTVLNNSNVTGFARNCATFLNAHFRLSSAYDDVQVVIHLDEKIEEKINKNQSITKIKVTYSSDKLYTNRFLSRKKLEHIRQDDLRSATVELKFKPNAPVNYKDIVFNENNTIEDYESLSISTEEETYNIIEKSIAKKIDITLSSDDIRNANIIEDTLKKHLQDY